MLEDRTAPAIIEWTGAGGDNLWETDENWEGGECPTINDTVNIYSATAPIVNEEGAIEAGSLMYMSSYALIIHDSLTIGSSATLYGKLVVDGDIHLGGQLSAMGNVDLLAGAVIDGAGVVTLTTGTLSVQGSATIENLDLSATVQGPGTLTITGTMNWNGGTLSTSAGTLDIADDAVLNIKGYGTHSNLGWAINADGESEINWTQGDVNNTDTTLNVGEDATFNISGWGAWRDTPENGLSSINNDGSMVVSGAFVSMPINIEAALNSTGTVDVQAGSLLLSGGGSYSGTFTIAADADVTLGEGDFTAFQGGQNAGLGLFIIGNGGQATVNVAQGAVVAHKNVRLRDGGTITGAGEFQMRETSRWEGGAMFGDGRTLNLGTFTISIDTAYIRNRTLVNTTSMIWTADFAGAGATIRLRLGGPGSQIINDGTFRVVTVAGREMELTNIDIGGGMIAGAVTNSVTGQIEVTGAGDVWFRRADSFTNAGTISVQGGSVTFSGNNGFTQPASGRMTANPGTSVTFLTGPYLFLGVSAGPNDRRLDGDGTFIAGDLAVINVPFAAVGAFNSLRASNFQMLLGSELTGGGQFSARTFAWNGGTMTTGPGQLTGGVTKIESGDVLNINGNVTADNRSLWVNSGGTLNWNDSADAITMAEASISVHGVFEIYRVNAGIISSPAANDTSSIVIETGGLMRKQDLLGGTSAIDPTSIEIPVNNAGGTMTIAEPTNFTKPYAQSGGAVLNLGTRAYQFTHLRSTGGTVNLNGGDLTVLNANVGDEQYQFWTTFNLSGVIQGWLINACGQGCTVNVLGNLNMLGGNNQIQVGLYGTTLHLNGFTLSIVDGQITNSNNEESRIFLEGGALNFQGSDPTGPVSGPGTMNGRVIS